MTELLTDAEVDEQLSHGWERDGDEIVRVYEFDDYLDGVDFAAILGAIAEEEFHHPVITIDYKTVEVRLTSHEAGGLTRQDLHLAELFDEAY